MQSNLSGISSATSLQATSLRATFLGARLVGTCKFSKAICDLSYDSKACLTMLTHNDSIPLIIVDQ